MGVVYRAHDTRLQRTVAIKVMSDSGSGSSAAEHARLIDEARAASALNHPNICTVFEVGEVEGRAFIAMEYVEGHPLAQSVPHGGLPPETVVRYGVQVADALAHAHARGVIHRDLKSANIVISGQGVAKVLDFGLARRVEIRGGDVATKSLERTDSGVLLGTLAYVAPEVLLGQQADIRSDIWGLGVILYEMATGGLPFKGRNEYELASAILRSPVHPFDQHVPPILRAIIVRCLAKEPAQRYQHAGEVRAALEAIQSDLISVPLARRQPFPRRRILALAGAGALLLLLLLLALVTVWVRWPRGSSPWERTAADGILNRIISTDEQTLDPALSPDGGTLAYVVQSADGRVDLFARRVRGGARIRLTDDAALEASPRFSADGERIAFARRGGTDAAPEIRIIPAFGGDVLATIPNAAYPAWSPDSRQLAYVRRSDGGTELIVSAADGSNARTLLRSDSVYPFLTDPAWSPDASEVAVVRGTGGVAGEIWRVPVSGGQAVRAIDEGPPVFSHAPVYTADGRGIVHSSNRGGATNIWFLPLHGGRPVRLTAGTGPDESPTIAAGGAIAFANSRWRNTLEAHDLSAQTSRTLLTHTPFLWGPAVSPDGRDVAFSRGEVDGTWHIWLVPLGGGTARQVASTDSGEVYPRWSPDRTFLLFNTWSAPRQIGRVSVQGGAPTMLNFGGDQPVSFADISPDGRRVAFSRAESAGEHIYTAPIAGGQAAALTPTTGAVPRWSRDGSRLAFAANRGFAGGIFVVGADGSGERRLTTDGGWPVWWPDNKQIGYLAVGANGDQEIRVVDVARASPRTLTSIKLTGTNHPFDISPDGRTIVVSNAVHISDEIWLLEPKK
jgi:Tol biopolymer transport system component